MNAESLKNLTIFVSSSDAYSDCWAPFFLALKKFWPSCELPIVLNTEVGEFSDAQLTIVSTKVGRQRNFGEMFRRGLEYVKTDYVLLFMIDYFFTDAVNHECLDYAFATFVEEELDGLYLIQMNTIKETAKLRKHVSFVVAHGPDRFSFQVALWKKTSLKKYVLRHEDPWMAERFGSQRYRFTNDRIAFIDDIIKPFQYPDTGALTKGRWIVSLIPLWESIGMAIDWNLRGFHKDKRLTLLDRIKRKRRTALKEARSKLYLFNLWLREILGHG